LIVREISAYPARGDCALGRRIAWGRWPALMGSPKKQNFPGRHPDANDDSNQRPEDA
jgi:hypothetical protein